MFDPFDLKSVIADATSSLETACVLPILMLNTAKNRG